MTPSFAARRKPKRLAREGQQQQDIDDEGTGSVVRRPGAVKKKSNLRVSFDPGDADQDGTSSARSENESTVVKPSRLVTSSTLRNRLEETSLRDEDTSRPSYSKSYLDELRNSTPSTPKHLSVANTPDEDEQRLLSIESKFGPNSSLSASTHIPSAAEIAEKKARRSRLAHEQSAAAASNTHDDNAEDDYIAFDSDGEFKPQRMQVGTYLQSRNSHPEPATRLVPDDEDIAEGYEQFTEDNYDPSSRHRNRITTSSLGLSRKSARDLEQSQREAMRHQIARAEHPSHDEGSDASASDSDDDASLHHAYELSQTHRGLDGLPAHAAASRAMKRPRPPRDTAPLPKLGAELTRLKQRVQAIEFERAKLVKRRADIVGEREELRRRQEHVQRSLEEASRELQATGGERQVNGAAAAAAGRQEERGLESMGTTPAMEDGEE